VPAACGAIDCIARDARAGLGAHPLWDENGRPRGRAGSKKADGFIRCLPNVFASQAGLLRKSLHFC